MIETEDIQGLIVRGYGRLSAARFLLLEVRDPAAARAYLAGAIDRVNRASQHPHGAALQLAFTALGLRYLGVPDEALATFSREFLEGMDDEIRAEALGDRPSDWEWGRADVHALAMIYATDEAALHAPLDHELAALAAGFRVVRQHDTADLPDHKEHFGWRDGLSMPTIDGVPPTGHEHPPKPSWTGPIPAGEFVLGYPNEYGVYSECPDFGRNGTYLVYRQYAQDVHAFWSYLARKSPQDPIGLGAKMVGRFPNGAPLAEASFDDPDKATANDFVYAKDPVGLACPIGAHIRRANPRDDLSADRRGADAVAMVRKHQMIRRGRPFGPPLVPTMEAQALATAPDDGAERGLHFICLVGQINRQFELVQRSWIQSANFHGLFKDGDPISASRRHGDNANDEFTVPCVPVRRKYAGMPAFTRVLGGAYFFLPSITALRALASRSFAPGSGSSGSPSTRPPPR